MRFRNVENVHFHTFVKEKYMSASELSSSSFFFMLIIVIQRNVGALKQLHAHNIFFVVL